jgi:hypothetical protein
MKKYVLGLLAIALLPGCSPAADPGGSAVSTASSSVPTSTTGPDPSLTYPSGNAVGTTAGSGSTAGAASGKVYSGALAAGMALAPGDSVRSTNGTKTLTYQADGNLVVYGANGTASWNSGTTGATPGAVVMQTDGNLVIYNSNGKAVWSSQTGGFNGAALAMQDDGNLVMYFEGSNAVWVNGHINAQTLSGGLKSNTVVVAGSVIRSQNGAYSLAYQTDGNLVMYRSDGQAVWESKTTGTAPGRLDMQGDGNLVIYDSSDRAIWASNTGGKNGAALAVQDDGNVVLYYNGANAIWSAR